MFFDALLADGEPDVTYSAADIADLGYAIFSDGAASGDALEVAADAGMSVSVAPGAAFVRGYAYILDSEKTLSLEAAAGAPRYDLVVLRLDIPAREIVPAVLTGTPAAEPVAPTARKLGYLTEIPLALIYVPGSATGAADCVIEDARPFAAMRSMEAPIASAVAAAISDLDLPGADEVAALRRVVRLIRTGGGGTKALCDDGVYRDAGILERVELAKYDAAGEYEFDPAARPSANGLYDVELIGGGGAGASVFGEYARGGGGGAGAHVCVSSLRLGSKVAVTVGAGGVGSPGNNGIAGGESRFGGYFADGGLGGDRTNGGYGAETASFRAENGADGAADTRSAQYLDECGAGAPSAFGDGGYGSDNASASFGDAGHGSGAGGSGAGGPEALSNALAGGRGADGAVIVYGYAVPGGE